MKKRILIFSTAYYPFVGGAEVAVKEITDRLVDFEFDLITARMRADLPRTEKIGNVTVHRLGFGKPLLDKLLLPFLGAMSALKMGEFLCFWGIMATYASGGAYIANIIHRLSGKNKIPMVLTLQEGDSESHFQYRWAGLINLSWRLALKRTDYLTALSSFLLHRAEQFGYERESTLVPNGVDLALFSKQFTEEEKKSVMEELGKQSGDIFLVTVSRLVRKNAVDDIISALSCLPANVKLLVIGRGEEGPRLQELANRLGLAGRVMFLGFVPHENIPLYLSISDIFIRPSRSEGFGNSFIEAMAARLPVVATPVGGIPDFVDDKITGFFCAPDNPKSIAETVRIILEDRSLVSRVVETAFDRVSKRYEWTLVASEMKDVFEKAGVSVI